MKRQTMIGALAKELRVAQDTPPRMLVRVVRYKPIITSHILLDASGCFESRTGCA